jgi:hypothetical protein
MVSLCNFDQPTWLFLKPCFRLKDNELRFSLELGLQVEYDISWAGADELLYWLDAGLPWHYTYEEAKWID